MATPIVSGAAAMMLSAITAQRGSPQGRAQELKELLQSSGDLLPGLATKSSRRLNVLAAVTAAAQLAGASAVAARPVKLDVAGSGAMLRGVRETYFDLKVSILMCSVRHGQHGGMQDTQALLGASRSLCGCARDHMTMMMYWLLHGSPWPWMLLILILCAGSHS